VFLRKIKRIRRARKCHYLHVNQGRAKQHKYARRYLAEAAYRFNRRFRLPEFVPRLLRAMVLCMPTPEPILRQATNFSS